MIRILPVVCVLSFGVGLLILALCGIVDVSQAAGTRAADCNQTSDPEVTIRGCTEIIESGEWAGPSLAWAHVQRGAAHMVIGNPGMAMKEFDRALELDPESVRGWAGRAWALYHLDRPADAVTAANRGFAMPDGDIYGSLYEARAYSLLALGRLNDALDAFDSVLRYTPDGMRYYQERLAELGYWSAPVEPFYTPENGTRVRVALTRCLRAGCPLREH